MLARPRVSWLLVAGSLFLASAAPAGAQEWHEAYRDGNKALAQGQPARAVGLLEYAVTPPQTGPRRHHLRDERRAPVLPVPEAGGGVSPAARPRRSAVGAEEIGDVGPRAGGGPQAAGRAGGGAGRAPARWRPPPSRRPDARPRPCPRRRRRRRPPPVVEDSRRRRPPPTRRRRRSPPPHRASRPAARGRGRERWGRRRAALRCPHLRRRARPDRSTSSRSRGGRASTSTTS